MLQHPSIFFSCLIGTVPCLSCPSLVLAFHRTIVSVWIGSSRCSSSVYPINRLEQPPKTSASSHKAVEGGDSFLVPPSRSHYNNSFPLAYFFLFIFHCSLLLRHAYVWFTAVDSHGVWQGWVHRRVALQQCPSDPPSMVRVSCIFLPIFTTPSCQMLIRFVPHNYV